MQKNLKHTNTSKDSERLSVSDANIEAYDFTPILTGELVAKIFIYYRNWQNPHKINITPFKLVSGKTFYRKHKIVLDNFAALAKKNKFNIVKFLKFCVIDRGINNNSIDKCLTSTTMINEFCIYMQKNKKLEKIYVWFIDTVKNIVKLCLEAHIYTTKDFLKWIIDNDRLGAYVASGKISIYYLAAIPSFYKIIKHLDYFSRQELNLLDKHFEIYHSEVNEAFLKKKKKMINPIEFTDLAILKSLKKIK